mgnify:FL=1
MDTLIVICTNILVPIAVALISSGKLANKLEKKFSVSDLSKKLDSLESKIDLNKAEDKRACVLRFNGEIKRGIHHDEEEFNECLGAIDYYEDYCRQHPDYPNSKAVMAIANVKKVYQKAYSKNDF